VAAANKSVVVVKTAKNAKLGKTILVGAQRTRAVSLERREERQVHLHRQDLPVVLAPARNSKRHQAGGNGRARHREPARARG